MLIYNYNKEFLGIDEHDLASLGFTNLAQLRLESEDFANLFVKTPGYVHNFKHVHWIDFVSCIEGAEDSKVIIHAKGKSYKCTLNIKTAYLTDNPAQKAYVINLQNLRALTNEESTQISGDLTQRAAPKAATTSQREFNTQEPHKEQIITPAKETNNFIHLEDETEAENLEVTHDPYAVDNTTVDDYETEIHDAYEDSPIDINFDDDEDEINEEITTTQTRESNKEEYYQQESIAEVEAVGNDAKELSNYQYDPNIASEELGLPIDLIEEFIEDFIAQAKEFKEELYNSLDEGNISQIKILSHKLKGVAANLRVEDAREALVVINTSDDINEIKTHMDLLYKIIAKLNGEEIVAPKISTPKKEIKKVVEVAEEEIAQEEELISLAPIDDVEEIAEAIEEEIVQEEEAIEDEPISLAPIEEISEAVEEETIELQKEEEIVQEELISLTPIEAVEEIAEIAEEETIKLQEEEIVQEEVIEEEPISLTPIEEEEIVYNKTHVANEIGLDEESFNELFKDYIQESLTISELISKAILEDDTKTWKQNAIRLKSMSENMRINSFVNELKELINTTDSNIAVVAIDKINIALSKISTIGGKQCI